MILVGNGTGLAGLRAHLRARAAVGAGPNWLLFGERNAAYDFHHQAELEGWHRQGTLQRLDVAFSRDQPTRVYVQHLLAAEGIRAEVKNLYLSSAMGELPPAECQAEVWVLEDADAQRAEAILNRKPAASGPPWLCACCPWPC